MKNLIFLLAFSVFLSNAFSQAPLTNSQDTLKASTTVYSTSQKQGTVFDRIIIQAVFTKSSGTPTGNVLPQGSLDGINFVDISTDTLKLANQTTNQKIWVFNKTDYLYYRTAATATSATQVVLQSVKMLGRNAPK